MNPAKIEDQLDNLFFQILLEKEKVVTALIVKREDFEKYEYPFFINVKEEGIRM